MATTKIKCPVEGIIDLDRLPGVSPQKVRAVIDAPEMQRLRRIKQLGFTELVYPSATHTRFAHSIGSFQGAQRTLTQLRLRGADIPDEWYVATALACLLHDAGHGPFSHSFERVSGLGHEERTLEIVARGPRIPEALEDIGPGMGERVLQLIRGQPDVPELSYLSDLVSSSLDCDRMDYLRRDALCTGASYGSFDRDWLIREMSPTEDGNAIVVIEKGRSAVEQYLIGRYHMFQNVYLHKTSRGFEGAFRALCARARSLGSAALPDRARAFRLLHEDSRSLRNFLELSDLNFSYEFELLLDHEDRTLRELARTLHLRRPLRQHTFLDEPRGLEDLLDTRRKSATRAGLDPDTSVWTDAAQDVPYRPYEPQTGRKGLRLLRRDGSVVDVTALSPTIQALSQRVVAHRVYWLGVDGHE